MFKHLASPRSNIEELHFSKYIFDFTLVNNKICDEEAKELAKALQSNTSLTTLELRNYFCNAIISNRWK